MADMNKKRYWIIRKLYLSALFKAKTRVFKAADTIETFWEYHSFRRMIMRNILSGVIKCAVLAIVMLFLDSFLCRTIQHFGVIGFPIVERSILVDVIIGSIGVAGVILGLYCSNISSIYSTRYANAPEKIAIAFQFDRLTRKCMSSIISFIIFGFLVVVESLLGLNISWATVIVVVIWAIYVLVSYSLAGNRVYQLSDIYRLAYDSYRALYRIINKDLKQTFFSSDINFQKYYLKEAEKKIDLLRAIHTYGKNENRGDNTTMVEFISKNFFLIDEYWKRKKTIGKSSLWFRGEQKYKRWHLSNSTETTIALRTGTVLGPKSEQNYWWFEDEIMSINRSCFELLMEKRDYASIYTCLMSVIKLSKTAVSNKEVHYYYEQVNWLKALVGKHLPSVSDSDETKKAFAGVVELITLLYLTLILDSTKYYQDFNIEEIARRVVTALDNGRSLKASPLLSGSNYGDFYQKILTEISVESYRITPTWVIYQHVAKDEYDYLNGLIDAIREGIDQLFTLGETFLETKLLLEACIIISRFYEFESKLTRLIDIVQIREEELRNLQIDKELKWDDFLLGALKETNDSWKRSVPELLLKSSCEFALINWENQEEYPDFLGESYNHICEDAVDSIVNNNIIQFEQDYTNLSRLMLLYQEYIRTDFLKEIDKYRSEYVYYMYTAPIIEWAQIGGLAILWGEFGSDKTWQEKVDSGAKLIFMKSGEVTELAERAIEFIQNRNKFMLGIGSRDILETEWNIRVANAIMEHWQCETEYEMHGVSLKTRSPLLKAFCSNFIDMGFMSDPSEVFWVLCVNPLLPKEKQFRTRFSWEDKINE